MRFLVDNQLPIALARYLQTLGFDSQHVLDVGLDSSSDADIVKYASAQQRIIVSKDEDFLYLAGNIQFLWVRLGNCRTSALLAAFQQSWTMIESCLTAGDRVVEIR